MAYELSINNNGDITAGDHTVNMGYLVIHENGNIMDVDRNILYDLSTIVSGDGGGVITNVGTITIGTWDATPIAVNKGGTGATTITGTGANVLSDSPTFTGSVVLPTDTSIGLVSSTEILTLDGVTSNIQTQLNTKAPIASPTFTGTVTAPTIVGDLTGNSTTATKLATTRSISLTGDVTGTVNFDGTTNVSITTVVDNDSHTHAFANLTGKPTTVAGYGITDAYTKTEVTTEVNNAIQAVVGAAPAALDTLAEIAIQLANDESAAGALTSVVATKAPIASPTFTGTVSGITKTMVGLGSVDNTADSAKNVLSATKLTTARTISLTGDVTGTVSFDGSADATITAVIVDDSHNHVISNIDGLQTTLDTIISNHNTFTTEIVKSVPVALEGQILYGAADNSQYRENGWLVTVGNFADNTTALNVMLSSSVSNADIFNTWGRFSHDATETQPAVPSELTAWTYNDVTDEISCTVNSVSHIGFYSIAKYDNYSCDVKVVSTQADNDRMGVVMAFYVDVNGREHTLTALRDNEGFTWRVIYNYLRSDAWVVSEGSSFITDGDNWSLYPLGTRIKVVREGDIFTCITTQNDSSVFVPASQLVIDLKSDPRLAKFRGVMSYGYSCQSQGGTTFTDITFTATGADVISTYVFDINNDDVYTPDGAGSYILDTNKSIISEIGHGRLIMDITTGKTWYINSNSSLSSFGLGSNVVIKDSTSLQTIQNSITVTGNTTAAAFIGPLTGNASTATKLTTARTINGVAFDGSANITISGADTTKLPLTGGTLTGTIFNDDVSRYWLATGTNWGMYWNTTDNALEFHGAGAVKAKIDLDDGTVTAPIFTGALTGNSATATKLATTRSISLTGDVTGTVNFDGTTNVSITTVVDNAIVVTPNAQTFTGHKTLLSGATAPFIELGTPDATAETPFIDFHSGTSATDYDARIIATGGNTGNAGGTLTVEAFNMVHNGRIDANGGLSQDGNIILNGTDTWLRTVGETGWYNSTHGTGMYARVAGVVEVYSNGKLKVNSTALDSIYTAGSITEASDERLKENITPLENSLDKVLKLQGVSYNKITSPDIKEIGFIAQDVIEILPEIVNEDDEGMLSVSYARTVALLVESIKEQQLLITDLKNSYSEQKLLNELLETRLSILEANNNS